MKYSKMEKGFTLIELMVVVVIIGVLASLAYPAYLDNVRATKRSAAQAELFKISASAERYFTENNTYVSVTVPGSIVSTYYGYSFGSITTVAYILSAAPKGAQLDDKCGTMTLASNGVKEAKKNNSVVPNCWR